ncbi:MAG: primosomal protein N' [Bacteriovoracaceae bacterium]|nr:primosomal protein N' [Bacteriovoracaceae bacterium]
MAKYCTIAVNCPLPESVFTYKYTEFSDALKPGMLVEVPFGRRKSLGCIVDIDIENPPANIEPSKLKEVSGILTEDIHLSSDEFKFYQWISKYYHYPLGKLIFDCLPGVMKRPRPLKYEEGRGEPFSFDYTDDQLSILERLRGKIGDGFSKTLIHGVTGSGKTIIYLELIKQVLNRGESVLFLLPEINLTPQFIKTFVAHICAPIYSYNSTISKSDKYGLWKLLTADDSPKVIIGVRSSIFLPVQKLGLVVVDEEHDQSFKQDDRCPYNARDIALVKGTMKKVPVILGSATPSVETYNQFKSAKSDKINYFKLEKRVGASKLPQVEMIDMRYQGLTSDEIVREKEYWPFTSKSVGEVEKALERGEQVLVFVNRLGFANYLQCRSCGHQFSCPNCSTNLRYFKKRGEVSCNYCDYNIPEPDVCPSCQNMTLHQKGFGTERLQKLMQNHFPTKRVERFDRDEIKTMTQLEERLDQFHRGEVDIMVGTQMLSKGHNFEKVNLVLILGIDSQLNFPDFRAGERVYQLLTQVAGRSGRFGKDSKVLIHTLSTDNQVFQYVTKHSFDGFYSDELPLREMCNCPPYTKIAMLYMSSRFQDRVINGAMAAREMLDQMVSKHFGSVEVLGPRPAVVEKKVNKFTWVLMLRSDSVNELHNLIHSFQLSYRGDYSIGVKLDVDPYNMA